MKLRLLLLLACLTVARAENLTGTWNVAKMTADGVPAPEESVKTLQLVFSATEYQLVQNGIALESGQVKLSRDEMDLTPTSGPASLARYKLDGDALSIAKAPTRPADLDAKPGVTRLELTRVPPPKK